MALLLETAWGDLVIDLDVQGSPELCKNILALAEARYYSQTLINTVVPNRFFQAGCPIGDGSGGTCIHGLIDAMNNDKTYTLSSKRFLKSSAGRVLTAEESKEKGRVIACLTKPTVPNTIGSQFWVTLSGGEGRGLDGFKEIPSSGETSVSQQNISLGKVSEDTSDVLDKINAVQIDKEGRPYVDIRIIRALVVFNPFNSSEEIPDFQRLLHHRSVSPSRSPSPVRPDEETVQERIPAGEIEEEDIDSDDEEAMERRRLRQQEIIEAQRRLEDKSRSVVLEMLGDLPSADAKADDKVLFICQMNPVTTSEDLELIFSRFDQKVRVDVITDQETGQSLQYAFAHFSTKAQASEAYFKMNNALIDDRRIKVDFSQSVSHVWDKYSQRYRGGVRTGLDGLRTRAGNQSSSNVRRFDRKHTGYRDRHAEPAWNRGDRRRPNERRYDGRQRDSSPPDLGRQQLAPKPDFDKNHYDRDHHSRGERNRHGNEDDRYRERDYRRHNIGAYDLQHGSRHGRDIMHRDCDERRRSDANDRFSSEEDNSRRRERKRSRKRRYHSEDDKRTERDVSDSNSSSEHQRKKKKKHKKGHKKNHKRKEKSEKKRRRHSRDRSDDSP